MIHFILFGLSLVVVLVGIQTCFILLLVSVVPVNQRRKQRLIKVRPRTTGEVSWKTQHPDKSQSWYHEKVMGNLRDRQ